MPDAGILFRAEAVLNRRVKMKTFLKKMSHNSLDTNRALKILHIRITSLIM
jgi:hypothetical protein